MAARKKSSGASKTPTHDYDSLLLRSAESLGRMIGALQRQLDTISNRLAANNGDRHANGNGANAHASTGNAKTARKTRKKPGTGPKVSAAARKQSKTGASRKSTRAR